MCLTCLLQFRCLLGATKENDLLIISALQSPSWQWLGGMYSFTIFLDACALFGMHCKISAELLPNSISGVSWGHLFIMSLWEENNWSLSLWRQTLLHGNCKSIVIACTCHILPVILKSCFPCLSLRKLCRLWWVQVYIVPCTGLVHQFSVSDKPRVFKTVA